MALQHTPDFAIIRLTIPDGTYTAFSFGEYLTWRNWVEYPLPERDHKEWLEWLKAEDNEFGRQAAFISVLQVRKELPNDPAVKKFQKYAVENRIPI